LRRSVAQVSRRQIAMLAALAVLVVPASALATPYLTLKEAGLAAKVAVGHRYHEAGRGSVEYFISPNTDCRRNSHISVDCGYEVFFYAGRGARVCSGTVRLRMTHDYKIISAVKPQPTCRLVRFQG
jgi:hypothetical protein